MIHHRRLFWALLAWFSLGLGAHACHMRRDCRDFNAQSANSNSIPIAPIARLGQLLGRLFQRRRKDRCNRTSIRWKWVSGKAGAQIGDLAHALSSAMGCEAFLLVGNKTPAVPGKPTVFA
jgi:hypothetical protein